MKSTLKIAVLLFLSFNAFGCSFIDDDLLNQEIRDFSRGVVILSGIIQKDFSLAEQVNTISFTDNLRFQLELGGDPQTTLKPLFSTSDIAARQSLLAALDGYAQTLAVVASGELVASTNSNILGTVENLKSLDSGQFNLSHSLSLADSDQLVSDVGLFEGLFILPERDASLVHIIRKGGAALKKTALLLYFDIGATKDQSGKCGYTIPKNNVEGDMSSLRLCRGGLRSIVEMAINYDTSTWKDQLSHLKANSSADPGTRGKIIQKLVDIQELNQSLDQLLGGTQETLAAMVGAHEEIASTVNLASHSSVPPLSFVSKTGLFLQKVSALAKAVTAATAVVSEMSAFSKSDNYSQPATADSSSAGGVNGK
ncbi:MAG: hypothetical protein K9G33_08215 [Sneathiella sp.]|nr:hypothetical protein [Sneathiella sp.]